MLGVTNAHHPHRALRMLYIRSLAFNFVFYVSLIVQMVFWTPYYFLSPRRRAWFVPKFWARTSLWLQAKIAGDGTAEHALVASLLVTIAWAALILAPGWLRILRGDLK